MKKLKKIKQALKFGLITNYIHSLFLRPLGIWVFFYYVYLEDVNNSGKLDESKDLREFSFGFLGAEDMHQVSELIGIQEENLAHRLNIGKKCYGARHNGKVAAIMWIDLDESTPLLAENYKLGNDEAYLYGASTSSSYRGKNIAPVLRYKVYSELKAAGRNKVYSYSELSNTPALRFKQKIGATIIQKRLDVELFKYFHRNFLIRRFKD